MCYMLLDVSPNFLCVTCWWMLVPIFHVLHVGYKFSLFNMLHTENWYRQTHYHTGTDRHVTLNNIIFIFDMYKISWTL